MQSIVPAILKPAVPAPGLAGDSRLLRYDVAGSVAGGVCVFAGSGGYDAGSKPSGDGPRHVCTTVNNFAQGMGGSRVMLKAGEPVSARWRGTANQGGGRREAC